jgi:hypothetical protein
MFVDGVPFGRRRPLWPRPVGVELELRHFARGEETVVYLARLLRQRERERGPGQPFDVAGDKTVSGEIDHAVLGQRIGGRQAARAAGRSGATRNCVKRIVFVNELEKTRGLPPFHMRYGTGLGNCNDVAAADGPGQHNSGRRTTVCCSNTRDLHRLLLRAYRRTDLGADPRPIRDVAAESSVRAGGWQRSVGADLAGQVLGVLGLGNIGSRVAAVGTAFGMKVIAWSENLTRDALSLTVRRCVDC